MQAILRTVVAFLVLSSCAHASFAQGASPDGADAAETTVDLPRLDSAAGSFFVFDATTTKAKRVTKDTPKITLKKGEWLNFSTAGDAEYNGDSLKALATVSSRLWGIYLTGLNDQQLQEVGTLVELRWFFFKLEPGASGDGLECVQKLSKLSRVNAGFCDGQEVVALKHLAAAKSLKSVFLQFGKKAKDDALSALESAASLESVAFQDWPGLTDAGLARLAKLKNLKELDCRRCSRITGAGLAPFKGAKLQNLNLTGCDQIGDVGCGHVATMKELRELAIGAAGVTDAGVKTLTVLEKLETLLLSDTLELTNACTSEFAGFKSLTLLALSNNDIDDACLPNLKKLTKLKALLVDGTQISMRGFDQLEEALKTTTVISRR
jgi:hypothetical protein